MASGTVPSSPHPESPPPLPHVHPSAEVVEYGRYIEREIKRTKSHVKWVEIVGGLLTLAAGVLAFVLAVAVADAWIVSAGLGTWARWLCLLVLLGSVAAYFVRTIWPVCVRQVNPVFAAYTIERGRPSLKNSLINFLLLRASPAALTPAIYRAVEEKAAQDLAQGPAEATVDRSRIIKLGYLLVGLMAVAAVYKLVSPKDPLASVGRLAFPWANIPPPRRVSIDQVLPGNVDAFYGEFVRVSAVVKGQYADEPVTLYYSTLDGQTIDQPILMERPADDYRHLGMLPAGSDGLLQNVDYYVRAGDAESDRFRVTVLSAPTILVKGVDLEYPQYTGLAPLTQDRGDVKALEGTRVTIRAEANEPIDSAWLDLGCDGKRDQSCQVAGRTATVTFPLKLNADGTPAFDCYQLRFTNLRDQENPQPIRHALDIVPDLAPEVAFLAPEAADVELPANGALTIGLRAVDPDFALAGVTFRAVRGGSAVMSEELLAEERRGALHSELLFDAAALKLSVGDEVLYWAVAADNKSPQPNRTETSQRKIRIIEPVPQDQRQDQLAQAEDDRQRLAQERPRTPQEHAPPRGVDSQDESADQENPQQPDGAEEPQPQRGQPQPDEQDSGEGQDARDGNQPKSRPERGQRQQDQRIDPDSNPADAIDKINEHREEEEGGPQDQQQQPGAGQPQPADESQPQEGAESQPQPGERQPQNADESQPQLADESQPQPGEGQSQNADESQPMPGEGQPNEQSEGGQQGQPDGQQCNSPGAGQPQEGGEGQPGAGQPRPGAGTPPNGAADPSVPPEQGEPGSQPSSQPGEPEAEGNQPGDPNQEGQPGERPADEGQPDSQRRDQPPAGEGSETPPDDNPDGQPGEARPDETPPAERPGQGQGDRSRGGPGSKPEKPRNQGEDPEAQGGNPDTQSGPPGAGKPSDKPRGSPAPHQQAKPRDKTQTTPPGEKPPESDDESGQSASDAQRESDSRGEDDGDRSGGGEEGGGQSSDQPGTGGAGQNSAAEEGSSEAPGEGTGNTSDEPGGAQQADHPTGESSEEEAGEGTETRPGGNQPGQGAQPGSPPEGEGSPRQKPKPPAGEGAPPPDGPPQGQGSGDGAQGGQQGSGDPAAQRNPDQRGSRTGIDPGDQETSEPPTDTEAEDADDPNLEYARKATDLALEHLRDQLDQDQPDQELLDELGWTREDMERFVRRWDEMQRAAQAAGPEGEAARQRLEEEYKSLGLRPHGTALQGDQQHREQQHLRLRESRRSEPPPEYAEQYRAYTQGRAKAKRGE